MPPDCHGCASMIHHDRQASTTETTRSYGSIRTESRTRVSTAPHPQVPFYYAHSPPPLSAVTNSTRRHRGSLIVRSTKYAESARVPTIFSLAPSSHCSAEQHSQGTRRAARAPVAIHALFLGEMACTSAHPEILWLRAATHTCCSGCTGR